jgi:hypothetical protein
MYSNFLNIQKSKNFKQMKRVNNNYDTMVEAIEDLKSRGFTHNFNVESNGVLSEGKSSRKYLPSSVALHELHRFEGATNPSGMSILYAVETDTGAKGTVVDAFGVDGSETVSKFMNHVAQKQFEMGK